MARRSASRQSSTSAPARSGSCCGSRWPSPRCWCSPPWSAASGDAAPVRGSRPSDRRTTMTDQTIARASAWMALGTVVSRITGLLRAVLLAAAIGTQANGDLFDIANTIPNSLYILLAGGVFNVVLVPQLVRAMKHDDDGGTAYANRVITLGLLVLGVGTIALMAIVPQLLHLVYDDNLFRPALAHQRESARLLMLLCLPQVFFYGAFVLTGQVLNARGRFGPMMWAPIVNNVVACSVIVAYVIVFGASSGVDGFSTS